MFSIIFDLRSRNMDRKISSKNDDTENSRSYSNLDIWMSSEEKPGDKSWYCRPSDIAYKLDKQLGINFTAEYSSNMTTIEINSDKKYQSILGIGISRIYVYIGCAQFPIYNMS
jgi:hypothetical protein